MITTILFDLDGVLVHTEEIHRNALVRALQVTGNGSHIPIFHFDGSSTRSKIMKFCEKNNLDFFKMYPAIDHLKQTYAVRELETLQPDPQILDFFRELGKFDYQIALCTNTRRSNMNLILERLNLTDCFAFTMAGDDGHPQKPSPEGFLIAMSKFGVLPIDTVILEDSPVGFEAVEASGAYLYKVERHRKLNWEDLYNGLVEADHHCANGRYGVTIS